MLSRATFALVTTCLLLTLFTRSHWTFDDEDDDLLHHEHNSHDATATNKPLPKDKILLRNVKTLTFYRNKRTTSRRTHSIHQLSCVGGTAGCRLFTPDFVECINVGYDHSNSKQNWRCHADMSDRVRFNHVEVICEGYDYPEDDYILVGSCGLEFTLDYTDPHDYHDNSYFKHLDEHEKEMHHERVRSKIGQAKEKSQGLIGNLFTSLTGQMSLIGAFILVVLCFFILVRYFSSNESSRSTKKRQVRGSSYGPLTSAVMTTKKAC